MPVLYGLIVVRNWEGEDFLVELVLTRHQSIKLDDSVDATAALWAFCRSAMLRASLPHFTSDVRNGKYSSPVATRRDVVCQSLIEGYNFFSCSEVNADNLSPTTKSGCGRGPLMRGMDLVQLSSTVLIYIKTIFVWIIFYFQYSLKKKYNKIYG